MSLILSFISSSLHITGYLEIYHKLFTIKAVTSVKFVVVHHHPPGGLIEQGPNPMCHVQHRSGDDLSQVPKKNIKKVSPRISCFSGKHIYFRMSRTNFNLKTGGFSQTKSSTFPQWGCIAYEGLELINEWQLHMTQTPQTRVVTHLFEPKTQTEYHKVEKTSQDFGRFQEIPPKNVPYMGRSTPIGDKLIPPLTEIHTMGI